MSKVNAVISGIGIISSNGISKEAFWDSQEQAKSCVSDVSLFPVEDMTVKSAAEVKHFEPSVLIGPKGLRNLDRSTLFLLAASKQAIEDAKLKITDKNTDDIGICTGTTFSHLWSIAEFDKEVHKEGLDFSNPALFPSNVVNAASSHVSIRYNIQGFNTTISTGSTSGLEALKYSIGALEINSAKTVLAAGVDTLSLPMFFGLNKLRYIAGINGPLISCPFDKRRNGPVIGEAGGVLCVENPSSAKKRGVKPFARVLSIESYFDGFGVGKVHPKGDGLKKAIEKAIKNAGIKPEEIGYISSCANSTKALDMVEVKVLKQIFGRNLLNIPVSSIKSMVGETFAASGILQIASCIGAMRSGIVPPTINYKESDPDCDINCVPNKAQKKDVQTALVISFGTGGYNSACILEKCKN